MILRKADTNIEAEVLPSASSRQLTGALLTGGMIAGPIYVLVGSIEILTRPGYDITRHALSLMANGEWGWIHIAMMIATGLLTIAGAIGMRRVMRGSRGGTWAPILLAIYGLGVTAAGIFTADPALGFPPGTPADANEISWHGLLHFMCGGIGFLGLIAACMLFARRFAGLGQRGWATYSVLTGVFFFAAFFGIAMGSQQSGAALTFVILAFTAAIVLGWAWISMVSARLKADLSDIQG